MPGYAHTSVDVKKRFLRFFCSRVFITSAKEGYVFVVVCLSVCLFVSNFAQKTSKRICMKFSGTVGNGPMNKWLNFGGYPVTV